MVNVHMINQTLRKSSRDGGSGPGGRRAYAQIFAEYKAVITTCLPGFSGLARHPCFKVLFEICVSN